MFLGFCDKIKISRGAALLDSGIEVLFFCLFDSYLKKQVRLRYFSVRYIPASEYAFIIAQIAKKYEQKQKQDLSGLIFSGEPYRNELERYLF